MGNLATNLQETAGQYPLYPALRGGGDVLSYADLDDLSGRVAGGLHAHGVRAGDTVGLMVPHGSWLAVLYYGVLRIGAAAVLLGCDLTSEDVGRRLAASEARLLFSGKAPPRADAEIAVGRDFLDQVAQWPLRADIAYRNDKDLAVLRYDEDDTHLVFARSLTHGALRAQAFTTATAALDLEPGDVVIGCPPAAAVGGVCCLNATVLAGACLLIPDLDAVADGEGAAAHVGPCTGTGHVKGW